MQRKTDLEVVAAGPVTPGMTAAAERYPFAITPFLRRRVEQGSYSAQALRQFTPDARELQDVAGYRPDPTGEAALHHAETIVQTYPDRALLMPTLRCMVYCRFCFRKDVLGFAATNFHEDQIEQGLDHIRARPEIEDVILTGGDPLALSNRQIVSVIERLGDIPHVRAIRIDSRALNTLPSRIDGPLLDGLRASRKAYYYAHLNHPDDVMHEEVEAAIERLLLAGVPVFNQAVILRGVNDDPETMRSLMLAAYRRRVLPYNLYILDAARGTGHFAIPTERVVEIYRALADLPGPAQPALIWVDRRARKHRALWDDAVGLSAFLAAREAEYGPPADLGENSAEIAGVPQADETPVGSFKTRS